MDEEIPQGLEVGIIGHVQHGAYLLAPGQDDCPGGFAATMPK
jgi:hypothetical protein